MLLQQALLADSKCLQTLALSSPRIGTFALRIRLTIIMTLSVMLDYCNCIVKQLIAAALLWTIEAGLYTKRITYQSMLV